MPGSDTNPIWTRSYPLYEGGTGTGGGEGGRQRRAVSALTKPTSPFNDPTSTVNTVRSTKFFQRSYNTIFFCML